MSISCHRTRTDVCLRRVDVTLTFSCLFKHTRDKVDPLLLLIYCACVRTPVARYVASVRERSSIHAITTSVCVYMFPPFLVLSFSAYQQ